MGVSLPNKVRNTGIVLTEFGMVKHQVVGGVLRSWSLVQALFVRRSQRETVDKIYSFNLKIKRQSSVCMVEQEYLL